MPGGDTDKAFDKFLRGAQMAKLPKAPPVVSDINVTPMVDVMLVLLIIFMVITPMLSKGVTVTMVKTRNDIKMQEADKEDAVLIAVTRDGKSFLSPGNLLIQPNDLGGKVKDLQANRSDKTVYVKADARARFSAVTDVIDNLRTVGVDQLGLITEEVQDKKRGSLGL
jgi:biopolymer transport protein ExbD/biopolymer transport protein TolR